MLLHPSPDDSPDHLINLSLLEVTQEGRIQASSGLAGKKTSDVYPLICNYENTRCSSEGFSPGLLEQQVWKFIFLYINAVAAQDLYSWSYISL